MRFLSTALIAAALFFASNSAAQTPSSVSGWYDTGNGFVRLVYSRDDSQVLIDILNTTDAGNPSLYLVNLHAPNSCPSTSLSLPLRPGVWFAVKSVGVNTLNVQVGESFAVATGNGTPETWVRVRALTSPSPYNCSTTIQGNRK